MSISTDLPPIPHPDLSRSKHAGPLIVQLVWNGDHEPGAESIGTFREFGPFQSVWLWADTLKGRDLNNEDEYDLATYRISKAHGGGAWHAADDLYYTDVVLYFAGEAGPSDPWRHERLEDWQYAAGNGDTTRGFAEWLREEAP